MWYQDLLSVVVCCCRYESFLKHFIFFAHRISLQLAIKVTQEANTTVTLWRMRAEG